MRQNETIEVWLENTAALTGLLACMNQPSRNPYHPVDLLRAKRSYYPIIIDLVFLNIHIPPSSSPPHPSIDLT